ncbi:MAG: hypothetical protein F4Z25_07360 [Chloroflexi bacterium]|nr:hypothetical protein [Chloroflexota bacterium]
MSSIVRATGILALLIACTALIAACTGGDDDDAGSAAPSTAAEPAAPVDSGSGFPTGPAVLVAADYRYPDDRVASTGAYLPANGKPTLVFVDAIW